MKYTTITTDQNDRVATVTLSQPGRRNALDDVMIRELTDAFNAINRDSTSRVAVLTGEGKAFCSGMDLGYLRRITDLGEHENLEDARNLLGMLRTIHTLRKPVIAMVNGPAMGGGCGLASACDFVFASGEHARLGVPEVKIGFVPAVILIFLIKRMGESAAREFVLRGGVLDAASAVRKGLATEVVPHDLLRERVAEFARDLATSTSPSSIALTKDLLSRLSEMTLPDAMEYSAHLNAMARKTDDFKRGLDSALKKENPRW
ncbi:MAG TPA: enoyl-CoA hydratase-related protein [Bacteroidota bacterium]|nr:enoyl-CoA hydratase-related protein [Bacteroidota bacterium]